MTDRTVILIVVNGLDGIVGRKVGIREEEAVETEAVGEFEPLGSIPLVLRIDTCLVELHACSRIGLSVITIGEADYLRSGSVDEIVNARISVVTCTIPHISVVSHLVLIVETHSELVVTLVVNEVILHIEHSVVNGIVVGEELKSESHVLGVSTGTVLDINERELA